MIAGDLLGHRARLTPEQTALVFVPTGERLSYAELDRRAAGSARAWRRELGLAPGERAAILAGNRPEVVEAFFAAGKSGVVLVPLNGRLTPAELAGVLADAEPRLVLYDGAFAETVAALRRQEVEVERWVALDRPLAAGDLSYPALRDAAAVDPWAPEPRDPEDLWCLLYTSGTTGRPKGVMIPHRQVLWNGYNTVASWQLRADDVSPVFTPLYHAGGLMAFLVPLVVIGGTVVLHAAFDAGEVWRAVERERATVILGVPTIWKLLLDSPQLAATDLASIRWLISGGAPLPRHLLAAYERLGLAFKQGFGMTEVGVNCFAMSAADAARKAGSIGRPMLLAEVRLVDAEGRDVGPGEVGEMWFRGPHVCRGYWRQPEATAAVLDAAGWFHSGDLASRDEEGFYYVAGRAKDLFISGGVNVYPAEIENELARHPEVADAAVVGVEDETWGEVGVAFIVPVPGTAPAPEVLAAFLAERLARYKLPRAFRFVPALPRTAYGKVVKRELLASWCAERAVAEGERAP